MKSEPHAHNQRVFLSIVKIAIGLLLLIGGYKLYVQKWKQHQKPEISRER